MRRSSIFIKLFLIQVIAGVLIFTWLGGATRKWVGQAMEEPPIKSHLVSYFDLLGKGLGNPADRLKAEKLEKEMGLHVRLEDSLGSWTSAPGIPDFSFAQKHTERLTDQLRMGRGLGKVFVVWEAPHQRVLFYISRTPVWLSQPSLLGLLFIGVAVTLAGAYFCIRLVLKPIHQLNRGVEEISLGNLKYRVATASEDELGRLARSFNEMSERIQEMIRSKEQLLLDISHELRSPLTRAKVALEYLPPGKPRDQVSSDLCELERMVAEILESSRLDSPHGSLMLAETDLTRSLKEWLAPYERVTYDASEPLIAKVDSERLRRVVLNLVENAVKYSSDSVLVSLKKSPSGVQVLVQDSGAGIPPEELEKVFEPFYRTDKSRNSRTGGYGLGLSLCRKILHAHGGKIWLESVLEKGTTAILELPLPH